MEGGKGFNASLWHEIAGIPFLRGRVIWGREEDDDDVTPASRFADRWDPPVSGRKGKKEERGWVCAERGLLGYAEAVFAGWPR